MYNQRLDSQSTVIGFYFDQLKGIVSIDSGEVIWPFSSRDDRVLVSSDEVDGAMAETRFVQLNHSLHSSLTI